MPSRLTRLVLAAAATAVVVQAARDPGRGRRLVSLLLHRGRPAWRHDRPEESRLYARGRRRLETHLGRRSDGSRVVVAVPVDGRSRCAVYRVGEKRPWHDFERQARLLGASWGPCRDLSAGL